MLSIVAAMSENRVIGRGGDLPWRLPDDLRFFKSLTSGHICIMGRKTAETLDQPLPNRQCIVITSRKKIADGFLIAHDISQAIEMANAAIAEGDWPAEVFIIGGGEIYRQILPRVDRMYLTLVHATIDGDTFFPEYDPEQWVTVSEKKHPADERHAWPFTFLTLERRQADAAAL